MSNILLRTGHGIRNFSRNGQPLLRLPQGEEVAVGQSRSSTDSWILRSAIVLSFLGVGFSVFSTRQLSDTSKSRSFKRS